MPCPVCFDPVTSSGGVCEGCGCPLPEGWENEFIQGRSEAARLAAAMQRRRESDGEEDAAESR